MSQKFRLETVKATIHFLSEQTETTCSFTEAVQWINKLAANLPVINDLADKAEERIRKGTKEKGLREAVQTYKDAGYNGSFSAFLLNSIYEYALFHNEALMHLKLKTVAGYLKEQVQPGFEQLRRLLTAFPAGKSPGLDGISLFQPIHAEVIGGQIWYSSDFPCTALLLMFRGVLNMTDTAICTCTVCGELFCGTANDECCGNSDCKKYLESSEPYQKKEDLSAITRCFSGRIRSIRHELREICETEDAVTEFNEFSKPLQSYVTSTVKALRIADAPVMKIRKFKSEVDRLYDQLNAKRKEIIAKFDNY